MQASSWPDIVALFREEAAGYSAKSAKQNAHRFSENEGIKARIAELRAQNAEKYQMSREETWRGLRVSSGLVPAASRRRRSCASPTASANMGAGLPCRTWGRISRFMTLL